MAERGISSPGQRRPRRDRRGRGLRGRLAPAEVPVSLSRSERFDDLVLSSLDRLDRHWSEQLDGVEIVVTDVPDLADGAAPDDGLPLGHAEPAHGDQPPRIVVHRRPVEARASGQRAREALVHEVMVAQLAKLLGLDPAAIDPDADD